MLRNYLLFYKERGENVIIKNGNVFQKDFRFRKADILIRDGKIEKIGSLAETGEEVMDAEGKLVIPGLTDLHFHGCVGYDFCDGTEEAITEMAKYQFSQGVTGICPATMTLGKDRLLKICETAATHKNGAGMADLVGINLEGPFISPDRCGAQNPEYVHRPDADFLKGLITASKGLTRLVTIAPEEEGALECIRSLKNQIRFSVGHTMADYDAAVRGFEAGARQVTHLFNAMSGMNHRAPGVVGAAADNPNVMAEMICDGIHIHPAVIRNAFRMFGDDRIILISDSMRACGMEDGDYELGGLPVVKKGNRATLQDGTLAGSVTNLFDCMVNVIRMGIPAESAIKASTYNPAKALGLLDRIGSIEEGKEAKLVILEADYTIVKVVNNSL